MKTIKNNRTTILSSADYDNKEMRSKFYADVEKMAIDPREFRNVCGAFATGVTVVTAKTDNDMQGMTANGFMSVSLDPALIVISVGNNQKIHKTITESGRYAVSILGASQIEVSNHFGGKLNPDLKIEYKGMEQTPYLSENIAYFLAKVKSSYVEGDHTLFIGEVEHFSISNQEDPLLFSKGQYKNIK